jgi:hypothetical protein
MLRNAYYTGLLPVKKPSNVMLSAFRDAIAWVDDRNLLELRARFVALDDTALAIPAIDFEVARRKHLYYARSFTNSPVTPAPANSTTGVDGQKETSSVTTDLLVR